MCHKTLDHYLEYDVLLDEGLTMAKKYIHYKDEILKKGMQV